MPLVVNGSQVNLDINANNNASPVIKQVVADVNALETNVKSAGKETESTTEEFGDMSLSIYDLTSAFAVVSAAVGAFIAVYEMGEIGAQNTRLIESGQALARSYGDSLDQILSDVSEASLGTVSNMSIIESANKAMMLGVTGSSEQMAQLMEIAALRGRAMGISTTQAFDDMVRGIGRLSPMILDNLGIVVDSEATYATYAQSLGKTSGELTRNEKIQALLNSVIVEGNRLLEDAGGLVDDNASKYERLQARIDNYQSNLAIAIDNAINPSIEAFLDYADAMDRASEATGLNDQRSRMYLGAMELENQKAREQEELIRKTNTARWEGLASLYETTTATNVAVDATAELAQAASDYYETIIDSASRSYDVQQSYIDQQNELKRKQSEVRKEIDLLISQGWDPYSEKVQDLETKYDDLGVKIDETAEKHRIRLAEMQYDMLVATLSVDGLTAAEYEIAMAAGVGFGVFSQESADAAILMNDLTQAVATGKLDVQTYGSMMKSAMADGTVSAQELRDMINSIPGEKEVNVNVRTHYGYTAFNQGKLDVMARASGGPVGAGKMYEVNERGVPELLDFGGRQFLMMPSAGDGYVTPLSGGAGGFAGGMGGGQTVIQIIVNSPVTIMDEEKAVNTLIPLIEQAWNELQSRGNVG
jgi:hypothetical protein